MKKQNLCKTLLLGLLALPLLSGCSQGTATGTCYWTNTGSDFGNYVFSAQVVLNKGTVTSATISETYLPAMWARINVDEFSDSSIEYLTVDDGTLLDGTQGKINFAKHIKVGDYTFTGTLRDSANDDDVPYINHGDYVCYRNDSIDASDTASAWTDLNRYLAQQDSGTYKLGGNCGWYFSCVQNKQIHAYGSKKGSSTRDVDYTLTFPENKMFREEATTTWTDWLSSEKALCTYLNGKKINYVYSTTDTNGDIHKCIKVSTEDKKTYLYNPGYANGVFSDDNWETITGCVKAGMSLDAIKAYFTAFNVAFASVEYSSML